ncbi:MAG: bifunctional phosphoribosyl-AMP cyclohydrolase/phosphoribosyl-ATP diphosphatase HisIE [Stygiobacter sp.]|jgi:phosphoribosyl-ATP pyrophosphohydrolase/phosphoribosyl-AMP cyclohydrolase|uniref:Histidine biosynthesis bifunctional protein HisIE n=1 Tax=Stygiobacter electus TaxID=3032292 RepID=A0AAE3TAV9_9BACT|nr:bifunctional phosphoribosyl-AMP cyclohydrolase/phosphoribosyl-ATP diphosphatase HisIE [Stygiobacter electus]MDF1610678.1 bifunctional phosphoribosyl-AMP cyclohydrolase/phosphoribosyl-ATP diphosphatase HisIE [Stygiobacter electus]
MIDIEKLNFQKLNGIIPAVIVDASTDKVVMLGFMNKEALNKTLETRLVTFFSRTKNSLWTKGETSGNYLNLVDIKIDCDNDSLLIYANPQGPTCHTGNYSCFNVKKDSIKFLEELFELIKKRKIELPENSYTTKLFNQGENRIIQKVGEEAIETVIAAKNNDKVEIINEVSDLIYHLFVLLSEKEIELTEIVTNLENRHNKK